MARTRSTALPIAHAVLRVLIVLNWLYGAAILALFVGSVMHEQWTFRALGVVPAPGTRPLIEGMRAIAALGLVAVPIQYAVLRRLLAIVGTVRGHDPFISANADRLRTIAWGLLALQILSLVIGGIASAVSTPEHPLHLDAGFSTAGWLAVLLAFVLARVFAVGTRMRDDLEGTV